jgi:outer membrane receptor protein involved in Fe transport
VRLAPGWRLTVSGARQEIASDDAHYATETNTRRWRRLRPNRIAETHTNRFSQVSATVEGTGDWGKLQSATTFVHHAFQSRYDASRALDQEVGGETVGLFDEPSRTQLLVQDVNFLSPVGRRVQWLAGVFALRSREETNPLLTSLSPSTGARFRIYNHNRLDRRTEAAAYGEVSYVFARDWTLAVGGRAFRSTIRTRSETVALGQRRAFDGTHTYAGFSPKVALSWAPPSGVLIYAMASQGYRAGGFNTGGFAAPTLREFSPDHLWNSEIGGKFDLLDGKLRVREALFYDIWSNIQTDQFDPDGLVFTYNVGEGRSLGLEAEVRYQPTPRLTLQANGLLTSTRLTRMFNPVPVNRESLPGAPRVSFNSLVLWEKPIPGYGALQLGGELGYVGRSHITFDRTVLPPSGGYITSRLLMEFRAGRWTFGGYLDNPTNSDADTFAYGNPFSFGQVRQATPLRPRTFRATLSAQF